MKIYNMIKVKIATGETIAEESFEYVGPLALAVDSVSGADGGADGDVMTADDRASNNKTAKDFMERERSAEEKEKCEDVQ